MQPVGPLSRLFSPSSIAVIGGGAWGEKLIETARRFGFKGAIWPVHPRKTTIASEPVFPDIAALPAPPDVAFIGINRHAAIAVTATLAERGCGGAICFASGFLEAQAEDENGADLQAELVRAAGEMPLIGPNCYGFINALDRVALWPDQQGCVGSSSGVAIVTQSSNIAINITMQKRALPLAYIATAGNQAQTGLADIGAALLSDPRVTALGLHIEGIGDSAAMVDLARLAQDLGKPIVALKVGASDQARAATISHTASLAGNAAGATAFLKRLGIARVNTIPELIESLKLLHVCGPLQSSKLASMSCSGGEAALVADMAQANGIPLPPLTQRQQADLRASLGDRVKLANPLDYHTYIWPDRDAMAQTFSAMMDGALGFGMLVADFPRPDRCDPSDWDALLAAICQTKGTAPCPLGVVASLPENMPEDVANRLVESGIAPLCGLQEALVAIGVAASLNRKPDLSIPVPMARTQINQRTLEEAQAKAALGQYGLPHPAFSEVSAPADLAQAARDVGFPLVLKGVGFAHKTEKGAVALNLTNLSDVCKAADAMPTNRFLVEQMIQGVITEMLIGVVADPVHGFVLTMGPGGIFAELMDDRVSLLLPVDKDALKDSIKSLKINTILKGYRGKPSASLDAIVQAVLSIQSFVLAHADQIAEVEINPLLCLPNRAVAADALIRIGDPT